MNKLKKEEILSIATMRNEGKTEQEIATILKVSRYTISYWVKRLRNEGHEIKRFPRGGRKAMEL
jgi:transposase